MKRTATVSKEVKKVTSHVTIPINFLSGCGLDRTPTLPRTEGGHGAMHVAMHTATMQTNVAYCKEYSIILNH